MHRQHWPYLTEESHHVLAQEVVDVAVKVLPWHLKLRTQNRSMVAERTEVSIRTSNLWTAFSSS